MDVGDVLVVDDESLKEVGDDGLLKGLATLFPSSVSETVSTVGVDEDPAFRTAERASAALDQIPGSWLAGLTFRDQHLSPFP